MPGSTTDRQAPTSALRKHRSKGVYLICRRSDQVSVAGLPLRRGFENNFCQISWSAPLTVDSLRIGN